MSVSRKVMSAAVDAAWPGLPEGMSMAEAKRRTRAVIEATQSIIHTEERRKLVKAINTQAMLHQVDDVLRKGGKGGDVLNLIMATVERKG